MKFLRFILGIISSFSLMFIALVTSIEIAAYSDFSFYEKEYKKYAVTAFVGISMPDLMDVTVDMMHYLNGTKDTLTDVKATIKDVPDTPFFNEREVKHMKDVRNLFVGASRIRSILIAVIILCIISEKLLKGKISSFISNVFVYGTLISLAVAGVLIFIVSGDFEKYFILFHRIFFTNDLWMLDPTTDNLINIVPEGFFVDMTQRILIIFSSIIIFTVGFGTVIKKGFK